MSNPLVCRKTKVLKTKTVNFSKYQQQTVFMKLRTTILFLLKNAKMRSSNEKNSWNYVMSKLLKEFNEFNDFFFLIAGRGLSLTRGKSFGQSNEADDDLDSMGEPKQKFCEYSFKYLHIENPVRKICIQTLMSP